MGYGYYGGYGDYESVGYYSDPGVSTGYGYYGMADYGGNGGVAYTADGAPLAWDSYSGTWNFNNWNGQAYALGPANSGFMPLVVDTNPNDNLNGSEFTFDPQTDWTVETVVVTAPSLVSGEVDNDPDLANSVGAANGFAQLESDMDSEIGSVDTVTSTNGMNFIKSEEQYKPSIYTDATGHQTYGYGHMLTADEASWVSSALPNMTDDQKQELADVFFYEDLQNAEDIVKNKLGSAVSNLSQNQFDALVSDAFNAGNNGALGPNMVYFIKSNDMADAGQQFNAYFGMVNGQMTEIQGLVIRNENEAALFNNNDYSMPYSR